MEKMSALYGLSKRANKQQNHVIQCLNYLETDSERRSISKFGSVQPFYWLLRFQRYYRSFSALTIVTRRAVQPKKFSLSISNISVHYHNSLLL